MRSMWLVIDDEPFDADTTVDLSQVNVYEGGHYAPLDEADEIYGEGPEDYIGRHRGEIDDI